MAQVVHEESLESEIQRGREQLAISARDDPQRAGRCHDLASLLYRRWKGTHSTAPLTEVIALLREALSLRPSGHPDRAKSCDSLGMVLFNHYHATGTSALLDEIIGLRREALALRPGRHPDRARSCNHLANTLLDHYRATGIFALLDDAITFYREALVLRPAEHPNRAMSCSNLANALFDSYQITGSPDLLDDTITLSREALALRPAEHPNRATSYNNLATALHARYEMTGTTAMLEEIVELRRGALALRPVGHPARAVLCTNLAGALLSRYRVTGISALLDDAITLNREALDLHPAASEHPTRAHLCNDLANALLDRYEATGTATLLEEIIELHRKALALRPVGHPSRAESCNKLAESLWRHFGTKQDVMVIDQALALARESATSSSPSDSWEALLLLCSIHLEQSSPHFCISTATQYLLKASTSLPSTTSKFMREIQSRLDQMWLMHNIWVPDTLLLLLDVYSNIIDRLSRLTGFALNPACQLTALRSARSFGSAASVVALLSDRPCQAVELIDHAHGVIWAQALHQRNPQLQNIPQSLACELETLLRVVSMPITAHALETSDPATRYLSPEDIRHQQNSRIQTILTEVRAIPGLDRFMLGRTYAQLREAASKHPVVVLVSARGYVHALVIRDSAQEYPHALPLKITSNRLSLLRDTAARVGLRQGGQGEAAAQDLETEFERAIRMLGPKEANPLATLADLWHNVVEPVIDHLQLQVRIRGLHFSSLS
jgi:tetratricopeptide (TPR) repeat protein